MKEINRYSVADSDTWLIHLQEEDGSEVIWLAMCPAPEGQFDPTGHTEALIIAQGDDGFSGLIALVSALAQCAVGCGVRDLQVAVRAVAAGDQCHHGGLSS